MKNKKTKIPEGWEEKKLEEITLKIGDGLHSTPNYTENSNYFFINGNNLINGRVVIQENTKSVSRSEYEKYTSDLDRNTLLLSINGTIGNVAYYNGEKIILGKSAGYIKNRDSDSNDFVYFLLATSAIKYYFDSELSGSTISNLSLKSIRKTKVLLPPVAEQKQIIIILKTWDRYIENLDRKIDIKKNIKKSLMQDLLTGKKRLQGFTQEWDHYQINNLFNFIKSYSFSRENLTNNYTGQNVKNIHYGDIHAKFRSTSINLEQINLPEIRDETFKPKQSELLENGDILIADVSEDYKDIGKAITVHGINNKKVVGGLHTIVLRDKEQKTHEMYRQYLVLEKKFKSNLRKIATGVSVYGISKNNLSKLVVHLPKLDEQKAISNILNTADEEIEVLQNKRELIAEQKKFLLNNLITGEIRLPEFRN